MGSGKTTIGKALSRTLNTKFLDLDEAIVAKEKKGISALFKEQGEIYFRKIEALVLREILSSETNCVLSLGGGTPCYANNMDVLNEHQGLYSFYLRIPVPELVNRLKNETEQRPLIRHLTSDASLTEYVAKHLFERREYYEKATYSIDLKEKATDAIVAEISLQLH
jgi:shikimate kinase